MGVLTYGHNYNADGCTILYLLVAILLTVSIVDLSVPDEHNAPHARIITVLMKAEPFSVNDSVNVDGSKDNDLPHYVLEYRGHVFHRFVDMCIQYRWHIHRTG